MRSNKKSTAFLNTCNKERKQLKKGTIFHIDSIIKYSEISAIILLLVKCQYGENYKTSLKDIKKINAEIFSYSGLGRINIAKMSIFSKLNESFRANPIKLPKEVFEEPDQLMIIFEQKIKGSRRVRIFLMNKNKVKRIALPATRSIKLS